MYYQLMNETFDRAVSIIKTFSHNEGSQFPEHDEIEFRDDVLTVHVTDHSLELPPNCSTEVNSLLGQAGLGHLKVVYVHSAGEIDLMVG